MSCIVVDFEEAVTVETRDQRKARKMHVCSECDSHIKPGDRYEYVCTLFDGAWDHMAVCMDCTSVRNALFKDGFQFGSMWEDLKWFLEDSEPDFMALNQCTPVARAKIIELFDRFTK
jgi:hypothetical protein